MVVDQITGLGVTHPLTIFVRILGAMLAGFVIGLERGMDNQPAGLRTHMTLSLGSCVVMILSIYLPMKYMGHSNAADPARLSAQVISGIGFLGAGAIIRYGFSVKGLTTAASIWTISGIGLCFGAGFYSLGTIGTACLFCILTALVKVENWLLHRNSLRVLTVVFYNNELSSQQIIDIVKSQKINIREISYNVDVESSTTKLIIQCRIEIDFPLRYLFKDIRKLKHIKSIAIE